MSRDPYRTSTSALDRLPGDRYGEYERVSPAERERGRHYDVRDEHFSHGAVPIRTAGGPRQYPDGGPEAMEPRTYYPHDQQEPRYTATRELSPSPPPTARAPRPGVLRRQSSLDTFDRLPPHFHQREEYGTPARRDDYRPASYVAPPARLKRLPPAGTSPLPRRNYYGEPSPRQDLYDEAPPARTPALDEPLYRGGRVDPYREPTPLSAPPVRRHFYDDINAAEPAYHGDDYFHPVKERETVRERESRRGHRGRRRGRSRSRSQSRDSRTTATTTTKSRTTTATSRSRSSSSSSSSSSSDATTVKNQYPKKGKTRIPARLVSKRALFDLSYPFEEDGATIIVLVALGQNNIDDLLKLSEDYKKADEEVESARTFEERKTTHALLPPPSPRPVLSPAQTQAVMTAPPPPARAPVVMTAAPESRRDVVEFVPPAGPPVEIIESKKAYMEVSSSHSDASASDYTYATSTTNPVDRLLESDHVHIGPLVLAKGHRHKGHKSRSRSRSRSRSHHHGGSAIDARIRELEAERGELVWHGRHGGGRRSSSLDGGNVVRYHEQLSNGDLVVYEERTEQLSDTDARHHHSRSRSRRSHSRMRSRSRGPRIEQDKKGRMSLKIPKYW